MFWKTCLKTWKLQSSCAKSGLEYQISKRSIMIARPLRLLNFHTRGQLFAQESKLQIAMILIYILICLNFSSLNEVRRNAISSNNAAKLKNNLELYDWPENSKRRALIFSPNYKNELVTKFNLALDGLDFLVQLLELQKLKNCLSNGISVKLLLYGPAKLNIVSHCKSLKMD
jgi:hypothetical protein